ncbi:MAG: hypothetical protein FWE19_08335 [Oscillospiraceae bacterium]|nr:hypothetical protein [Oscillospiraceae bacterium]
MAGPTRGSALGLIFALQMEEAISDQQVERVLGPVLAMVKQGGLRREAEQPKRKTLQYPYLLTATAMVAVVVVGLLSNLEAIRMVDSSNIHVEVVRHFELPAVALPGPVLFEKVAPDYAYRIGGNVRRIELAVVEISSRHLLGVSAMGSDGVFRFDPLSDGNYRAVAMLPEHEDATFGGIEIGSLVVTGGRASLVLSEGLENFWEGVEIQICLLGSQMGD